MDRQRLLSLPEMSRDVCGRFVRPCCRSNQTSLLNHARKYATKVAASALQRTEKQKPEVVTMRLSHILCRGLVLAVVAVCLLAVCPQEVSRAQSDKPEKSVQPMFNALRWRSIGPNRGGRSLTVAGSASRPFEYYFGAVGGGLWKTTDGGTTWRPVTDGQLKSSSVGAVAVSQSNPDVVYIGMGETQLRGNIMQGDGVYKSVDAGKTWRHIGLSDRTC